VRSLIFDLFLLEHAQAQAHVHVNEAILKLEKGARGYYAFDVADGNIQMPTSDTYNTIKAYGSGTSLIIFGSFLGRQSKNIQYIKR